MKQELGIIGSSSFVGKEVVRHLFSKNVCFLTPGSKEVDITDPESVDNFVNNFEGRTILLLAAFTKVDGPGGAEEKMEKAMNVNWYGTKNVAEAARKYNKFLIYVSTDFVFPGTHENPGPYFAHCETAHPDSPLIGEYARSKLLGEMVVKSIMNNYAIVRISYPFGDYSSEKDFVRKLIGNIKKGTPLFSDQKITPTYIPDLADAIMKIDEHKMKGIFHIVTWPPTTPYKLGKYIVKHHHISGEIKKGSMEEFMVDRTPRPLKGGLVPSVDLTRRHWKTAIDNFIDPLKLK